MGHEAIEVSMSHEHNARQSGIVAQQVLWLRRDALTTPMHVIKLAYLCHGWMLGICGRPLITEAAEAWRYGPVVPSVYRTYKSFGGEQIDVVTADHSNDFDEEQTEIVGAVIRTYMSHSAWSLSAITHQPGTPWHTVYRGGWGEGAIIPNKLIQEHYEARIANSQDRESSMR